MGEIARLRLLRAAQVKMELGEERARSKTCMDSAKKAERAKEKAEATAQEMALTTTDLNAKHERLKWAHEELLHWRREVCSSGSRIAGCRTIFLNSSPQPLHS